MGSDAEMVRPRLVRGCRAFACFLDGQVVAYAWFSTRAEWIGELGVEIAPGPGEAYVWNCVTVPSRRHQGYFRALLLHVVGVARQEGLRRLWIGGVDGGAERAVLGAGFEEVLSLAVYTAAGLRWIRVAAAAGAEQEPARSALRGLGKGRRLPRYTLRRVEHRRH